MDDITVTTVEDIQAYEGPNEIPGIRFRGARAALGITAWGMNVLDLEPNCDGYPEHDHAADQQEELYVILRGSAVLLANDKELAVTAGSLVRVSPNVTRKFVTRDEAVTILAVGGTPGKAYEVAKAV